MSSMIHCDLAIMGGGAGGLSVAAGAAQMGVKVVLIEPEKMGGDCLNYGCIPSKALLAAAKTAEIIRRAGRFGIKASEPEMNMAEVMQQVQKVIDTIAVHDSIERFEKLGVRVIKAAGEFKDAKTLRAGEFLIKARRFVIATGSSPAIPPIAGLDQISFLTNETIFSLTQKPEHLIIIGGGPIGCEFAQAFLMLGTKVTVLEGFKILPHDEQDLVSILREHFAHQGLNLFEGIKVLSVAQQGSAITVLIEKEGVQQTIQGSHLVVATGRKPNLNGLNLERANIAYTPKGIQVNARLCTTNSNVYAMGDVAGSFQFTHVAGYHAGIVLKNILFKIPAKVDYRALPWVTYTLPELAHVGLSSEEALKKDPRAKIFTWDFAENDRAQAEHEIIGKIKLMTDRKGKILGVSILGPQAGELLAPWIMAIQTQKTVRALTDIIIPYPTLSEINKRVAGEFYTPILFSKRIKWLVRLLGLLG